MPHQPPGRFRMRPVVIEAMPFDGTWDSGRALSKWVRDADPPGKIGINIADPTDAYVETLEGLCPLLPGDWVIKGLKGGFSRCPDDLFHLFYTPVED